MRYYEEQIKFVKEVLSHAKEVGLDNFAITYDHFGPNQGPLKLTLTAQFREKELDKAE